MNALISASRLPSLHSRGFPCCGIETGSRQGKTGGHTNIRRREKVGIGLSPKIVSFLHSQEDGTSDIGVFCLNLIFFPNLQRKVIVTYEPTCIMQLVSMHINIYDPSILCMASSVQRYVVISHLSFCISILHCGH